MIAKESNLRIVTSYISDSSISFITSDLSVQEIKNRMHSSVVEIDFDIKYNDKGSLFVFSNVRINCSENPHPGYSIDVHGATVFSFMDGTHEDEKKILIQSAVSISITNLRNYINNATSYYPLGSFNFHSVDMKALFDAKSNEKE